MEGNNFSQVGESAPIVEVIRKVLAAKGPITISALCESLKDALGRSIVNNPYEDYCLVYKLAVGVLKCQVSCENLEGKVMPVVPRTNPEHEPVAVTPGMRFEAMNTKVEEIGQLVVSLSD